MPTRQPAGPRRYALRKLLAERAQGFPVGVTVVTAGVGIASRFRDDAAINCHVARLGKRSSDRERRGWPPVAFLKKPVHNAANLVLNRRIALQDPEATGTNAEGLAFRRSAEACTQRQTFLWNLPPCTEAATITAS